MNTIRTLTAFATIALFCGMAAVPLFAQDAAPDPTPREPLIPRAPDMASWTITYRYKQPPQPTPGTGAPPKPPEQIVSVQVQKTDKIYRSVTNWSSGAQTEAWTVNQRELVKDKSAATYSLMPTTGPATDDYSKSDFEDISWISIKYYTGFKKGDQPVFVFQGKNAERPKTRRENFSLSVLDLAPTASAPKPGSSPGASPTAKPDKQTVLTQIYGDSVATVVLDAKTQLPLGYDDGKIAWAYQYLPAPAENLVPPPEVTKLLQRYANYVKGTTVHPSAP